jgi:hypothetical protein
LDGRNRTSGIMWTVPRPTTELGGHPVLLFLHYSSIDTVIHLLNIERDLTSNDWTSKIPNVEKDTTSNKTQWRKTKHREYSTSNGTQHRKTVHTRIWTSKDWPLKNSAASYYDIIIDFEVGSFYISCVVVSSQSFEVGSLSKFSRSKLGHSNDPTWYDPTSRVTQLRIRLFTSNLNSKLWTILK